MIANLAELEPKAPRSIEVITRTIHAVEAALEDIPDQLFGRSEVLIGGGSQELTIGVSSWNHKTGLTSSIYHRAMSLRLGGGIAIDGVTGRQINYNVDLRDPNKSFDTNGLVIAREIPSEPIGNTIAFSGIKVASRPSRREDLLFAPGELEDLSATKITQRFIQFSALVDLALGEVSASPKTQPNPA
jgi:hypothetical protein